MLTTRVGRRAASLRRLGLATLARTTLRSTALQDQVEILASWLRFCDWILRHDAAVVFDIDI